MPDGAPAICPACEQPGAEGAACASPVCARRGMHCIPGEHVIHGGAAPDPMVGRMVGDYLVARLIGEGGFGKVYLALQQPIGMEAALKLMRPEQLEGADPTDMLARFEGEARAMARLRHPNIVRLLHYGLHRDADHTEPSPYLVMEFVPGARSLKSALAGRDLSRQALGSVLSQLLSGLESAHALQIVHRDIKPENIMLQAVAGQPHLVRILDFGLAKFVADRSETSVTMGTPMYMAPEQLNRKHIGPWTDLYAVGVMTFEAFTGRRPYQGCTLSEVLRAKIDPASPLARLGAEGLPGALTTFLERAMAFDPNVRFRTAAEMRAALEMLLSADSTRAATTDTERQAAPPVQAPAPSPTPDPPDPTPSDSTGRPDAQLDARAVTTSQSVGSRSRGLLLAVAAVALLAMGAGAARYAALDEASPAPITHAWADGSDPEAQPEPGLVVAAEAGEPPATRTPAARPPTTPTPTTPTPTTPTPTNPTPTNPTPTPEPPTTDPPAATGFSGSKLSRAISNLEDARSGLCPAARKQLARKLRVSNHRANEALAQAVAAAQERAGLKVDGQPGRKTLRALFGSDIRLSACPECAPDLKEDAQQQMQARMGVRPPRRELKVIGRSGTVHVEACDEVGRCVSSDYSCSDGCCLFMGMSSR